MSEPDPATYPCPACNAPANLATGCPACGRRPDPEAAEVIRLGATIRDLREEIGGVRQEYAELLEELATAERQRNELAARVRARTDAEAAVAVRAVAGTPPTWPGPTVTAPARPQPADRTTARPEASSRTVQSVLFVLGGLLLGSAAIVFTAVAWANFGVVGRAAILATVTVLILAVPPVALLRRLAGTAETFAALGLLLVLLDGYAAWYVNLAGVHALAPATYAGIVCAVTALVAVAYGLSTHLTGPQFAALLVAQPALPLLAVRADLGPAGWATVFAAVAAGDIAVARWAGRPHVPAKPVPAGLALRITAWALGGLAVLVAGAFALFAVLSAGGVAAAIRAGLALVLVATVVLAATLAGPVRELRHVAAGVLTLAVVLAAARVTGVAWPGLVVALIAAEIAGLAVVTRALPGRVRPGPRVGMLVAAGVLGLVVAARSVAAGVLTVAAAGPVWHAALSRTADGIDWQLPVAIALASLVVAILVPRVAPEAAVGGAVLLAFAVPASAPLPWWAPSAVDLAVAAPLAVAAVRARSARRAAVYGGAASLLAVHAVLAGLGRPSATAGVLGVLVAVAAVVAGLGTSPRSWTVNGAIGPLGVQDREQTGVGAVAAGVALLALPGLAAALAATAGAPPAWACRFAAIGFALAVAGVVALRRWPDYARSGALAVLLGGAGLVVAALTAHTEPYNVYASLVLLGDLVAALAIVGYLRQRAWALVATGVLTAIAAVPALVGVAPAVASVLIEPYSWVSAAWSFRPAGVGLGFDPLAGSGLETAGPIAGGRYALGPAAVALALLSLTLFLAGRRWRPALLWWTLPAKSALLAGAAAVHAPWPTVPALTLAIGVTAALAAALRWPSLALAVVAATATGAGLAGSLPTKATTLAALAVILVASVLCGLGGRRFVARAAGWLVAVASAAGLALAAALAAEISVHWAALWVLGAAALALGASALLSGASTRDTAPRSPESRLVEGAAHATALVAALLTIDSARFLATVCVLWGLAVGLRALWPGDARRVRVVSAAALELLAYWLLLLAGGVTVLEAYTLPAAGVALLAGWLAARSRPALHSWSAYGPALLAGFGPSLVTALAGTGEPWRRLAIGVAAVVVVIAGSVRRRQSPVVVGGTALTLVALHEAVLLWDLMPRWIPLAAAGLVLVGLAMTYERRRRDVVRLRQAVTRMR